MSRFFEFLQKLEEPPGTSVQDSEKTLKNGGHTRDARQILSVLHRPEVSTDSPSIEPSPELGNVLVEEVRVAPATHLFVHTDPTGLAADRFRLLRMRLSSLRGTGKLKSILVTSPLPGDGKSTVALNLATALAEGGNRKVLLIDADLHHASLNHQLGIKAPTGLMECLKDGLNPLSVIKRIEPLKWYLLPAGGATANPTELLQTESVSGVLQKLSPHFDWIIIDSPPVIPLTDAVSLTRHTDATLLVARAGSTPETTIESAISLLDSKHVIGIVLNGVDGLDRAYSRYKYSGYYGANGSNSVKPVGSLTEEQSKE
jgi:capsular exopolysaccharide synthesis family protein